MESFPCFAIGRIRLKKPPSIPIIYTFNINVVKLFKISENIDVFLQLMSRKDKIDKKPPRNPRLLGFLGGSFPSANKKRLMDQSLFPSRAEQSPELEAHGCANEAVATGRCALRLRSFVVQLRLLARCGKDACPHKAKSALWVHPFFLHELNSRLRFSITST